MLRCICIYLVIVFCSATPSFAFGGKNRRSQESQKVDLKTRRDNRQNQNSFHRKHSSYHRFLGDMTLTSHQIMALGMIYLITVNSIPVMAQSTPHTGTLSNRQLDRATGLVCNTGNELVCDAAHGCVDLMLTTTNAIGRILCPSDTPHCVSIANNRVTCSGDGAVVEHCQRQINDLDKIRKEVVPVTPAHGKTKAYPDETLPSFDVFSGCLGFPKDTFANLDIVDHPHEQKIALEYDGAFNVKTADSFLQTLREESPFFKFILDQDSQLIEVNKKRVFIHYRAFNTYLGSTLPKFMRNEGDIASVSFPLDHVLKKIIAAVSGTVALEPGQKDGHFRVATITDENSGDESSMLNTKIYLDQSGSMDGAPIASLNAMVPELLVRLQKELKHEQMVNVTVFTFDDKVREHQSMKITEGSQIPPWQEVPTLGLTNLIPIGEGLKLDDPQAPQMVIAFTDGAHNGPSLEAHYDFLSQLQASGQFAEPHLCKVGDIADQYFDRISKIFAGSVHQGKSVPECIDHIIQAIPKLIKPKKPIVLTVRDGNLVVWQQVATGVQTTSETVTDGDTITFGKFKAVVSTVQVNKESKEEKLERLRREIEALESEK